MREFPFRKKLKEKIKELWPEVEILSNDAEQNQGFPDITLLFPGGFWVLLETKRSKTASYRPNQKELLDELHQKGYARMVCPENAKEVLDDIQRTYSHTRRTFVSKPF